MSPNEFRQQTGLSVKQLRRLTEQGLIPFSTTEGGHKRFNHESLSAARRIISGSIDTLIIGPMPESVSNDIQILEYLKPPSKQYPEEFVQACKLFIKQNNPMKVVYKKGLHVMDTQISTELYLFCFSQSINFEGVCYE